MHIQCPACETAYEVPDQIRAGRTVQCAACGVKWAPVPAPTAAAPIVPTLALPAPALPALALPTLVAPAPVMLASDTPAQQPGLVASPRPGAPTNAEAGQPRFRTLPAWVPAWARRSALPAAWAASLALVIALAALAIMQRDPVMRAWPPSTRLFAALGLH